VLRYLVTPSRGAADLERLARHCHSACYIVNDFHPLLLVAGSLGPDRARALPCPVVHVYGRNLWRAVEGNFRGRGPALVDRGFGALLTALRDRAHARVEHTFAPAAGDEDAAPRTYRVPPILAAPRRSAAEVRSALGVGPGARLAAVYLNPHFEDPSIADATLAALSAEGFVVHAVGEGLAGRPGFRPYDPSFADVGAAADLLVSAPGMGALAQARVFGVPFVALVTDQPEQRDNLRFLGPGAPFAAVELGAPGRLDDRLREAAIRASHGAPPAIERPSPSAAVAAIHARWTETFTAIAAGAAAKPRRPRAARATTTFTNPPEA
jgi:hypothetical protein